MTIYIDDNFGAWTGCDEDESVRRFYFEVQRKCVEKECLGCGRKVSILPKYAYCNSCADKRERGFDL